MGRKECLYCGKTTGKFIKNSSSCEDCRREYNRKYYKKRKAAGYKREYVPRGESHIHSWYKRRVTVNWCPRNEWPRMRYFSAGQFSSMLEDGVCTPGMYVTQHDTQYIVWGPKGEEQWMQRL